MPEKEILTWKPLNKHELATKGKAIYEKIRDRLETEHRGEVVAIEVNSGDYFVGETIIEACDKGREKYPEAIFYSVPIGRNVYFSFKAIRGGRT